jgi:anti-sigma regulatory factor (Ser/Thr protein kinase)
LGNRGQYFQAHAAEVEAVRDLVAKAAVEAGVDQATAVLAASELATNAVIHGGTPFRVTALAEGGRLRVEVKDFHPSLPHVIQPTLDDSAEGYGLAIVGSITQAWGVVPERDGKTVWFELTAVA